MNMLENVEFVIDGGQSKLKHQKQVYWDTHARWALGNWPNRPCWKGQQQGVYNDDCRPIHKMDCHWNYQSEK